MADAAKGALTELGIEFQLHSHPAVFTVEEQEKHIHHLPGHHTKNLFMKDKKHGMFLVTARANANVSTKNLPKLLGITGKTNLRMCSADTLMEKLGVAPGSVSPLCVMNNKDNDVRLVLDQALTEGDLVNCHPNQNDETVALAPADLLKFVKQHPLTVMIFERQKVIIEISSKFK